MKFNAKNQPVLSAMLQRGPLNFGPPCLTSAPDAEEEQCTCGLGGAVQVTRFGRTAPRHPDGTLMTIEEIDAHMLEKGFLRLTPELLENYREFLAEEEQEDKVDSPFHVPPNTTLQ